MAGAINTRGIGGPYVQQRRAGASTPAAALNQTERWSSIMAYRSLTLAAFACLALAGPAAAGSSTECHGGWFGSGNGGWGPKRYIYECQATSESRYGTTQTTCNSRFGCVTTSEAKRQPAPIVQDPLSTRIMDGHGPR